MSGLPEKGKLLHVYGQLLKLAECVAELNEILERRSELLKTEVVRGLVVEEPGVTLTEEHRNILVPVEGLDGVQSRLGSVIIKLDVGGATVIVEKHYPPFGSTSLVYVLSPDISLNALLFLADVLRLNPGIPLLAALTEKAEQNGMYELAAKLRYLRELVELAAKLS